MHISSTQRRLVHVKKNQSVSIIPRPSLPASARTHSLTHLSELALRTDWCAWLPSLSARAPKYFQASGGTCCTYKKVYYMWKMFSVLSSYLAFSQQHHHVLPTQLSRAETCWCLADAGKGHENTLNIFHTYDAFMKILNVPTEVSKIFRCACT